MFSLKGKVLNRKAMVMLLNVQDYLRRTNESLSETILNERTAEACGVSLVTVYRTKARFKDAERKGTSISSPHKTVNRPKSKSVDVDDYVKDAVRRKIYCCHQKRLPVTLCSLVKDLRDDGIFEFSIMSLKRLLPTIGFTYHVDDQSRGLVEQPDIAAARAIFLRQFMENKEKRLFDPVYVDETWIFEKGSLRKNWHDEDKKFVKNKTIGGGKRYVIVHAGNNRGFIKGSGLLFSFTSNSADYQDSMNADLFKQWFTEQLLPNLDRPSLIILDNASYHSRLRDKMPSLTWSKEELIEYLKTKNITYQEDMLKAELYSLAKNHTTEKVYEIDELANQWGHKVIRLPPHHFQFNAIELVWANCKQYYNKHIGRDGYGNENAALIWNEALSQVTAQDWAKCITHSEEEIMKWLNLELCNERMQEPLIVKLEEHSSDEDEESDDA